MPIKPVVSALLAAAMLVPGVLSRTALAAEPETATNTTAKVPDDANTPVHASNDIEDARVTEQIRGALRADGSLSEAAKNVGIAANPEAVILRGAVSSVEKERIETLAEQYAGARQVDSQLTVKDSNSPSEATGRVRIPPR